MQNSLVVIPTFNEVENIQSMIDAVLSVSLNFHILVVDDSSPMALLMLLKNENKIS